MLQTGGARIVRHASGTCLVGLSGVSRSRAEITSDCDAPLSGPTVSVGETVTLTDRALRVFLSGAIDGDARLAINGLQTRMVSVGEAFSVEAGDRTCTVRARGIRGNALGVTASCG